MITLRFGCLFGVAFLTLATMAFAQGPKAQPGVTPDAIAGMRLVRVPHATRTLLKHLERLGADFWTHSPSVGLPVEVALTPAQARELGTLGIEFETLIADLAVYEAQIRARDAAARAGDDIDWYGIYRTPDEFADRLEKIKAINPAIVRSSQIGESIEGRPVEAYRVTGVGSGDDKPALVFIGGTHAREWVAHMASMYTLEHLVRGYGHDADTTRLLDNLEFIFIPLLNPDGVAWSHSNQAMWRKNRRGDGTGAVWGVDNNRNYSVGWGIGVDRHPGGQTYPGEFEFSEPENLSLRDFLIPIKDRVAAVVDVHAYGGVLYAPYSYEGRLPRERFASITQASEDIATAMSAAPGLGRTIGWATPGRYGGTSKDWAFDELDALSWTFELGESFMPPLDRIKPWGRALLAGAIELGEYIDRPVRLGVYAPRGYIQNGYGLGELCPITMDALDGHGVVDPDSVRIYQEVFGLSELVVSEAQGFEGGLYQAHLLGATCEHWVTGFFAEATTTDGRVTRVPADGSLIPVEFEFETFREHDCESGSFWTLRESGDTATTGLWIRGDPQATPLQPEHDTTPGDATDCMFTDHRATADPVAGMVNGVTTLVYSGWVAGFGGPYTSGEVSFMYWAARPEGSPPVAMVVDTSVDGGASWSNLTTLHADQQVLWRSFQAEIPLVDYDRAVLLRFRAGVGEGDVLGEFGIDDVRTVIRRCDFHPADFNRDGVVDLFDMLAFQTAFDASDPRADFDGDGEFTIFDFLEFQRVFEL